MNADHRGEDRCSLCGTPIGPTTGDGPTAFCSSGCREVHRALGEAEQDADDGGRTAETATQASKAPDRVAEAADRSGPADPTGTAADDGDSDDDRDETGAATERAYFRIDGMHTASCEAFLESIAEAQDGVTSAAASYVTESIRVDHDPDRVSKTALRDALSTIGYTAYPRDEATNETEGDGGSTRRDREMTGMRKRRSEDMLELRYVVGIVFGSFLLVPYVTIFYPVYLSAFTDWWMLSLYEDAFGSLEGPRLLPLFAGLTAAILYLTGRPLLRGAYVSLTLRRPDTRLLAALTIVSAFLYGTVALLLGRNDVYFDLTILVAVLVMGATFYETMVKRRAMNRLTDLTVSQVDDARRLEGDGTTTVPVGDLDSGDRVLVREGERIPVDGVLAEGPCTVDEAIVTGDSLPVTKRAGDEVVGGSIVRGDAAVVAVGDRTTSSIDRLTETVWDVQSADHGGQRVGDRLATVALPIVLAVAAIVGLYGLTRGATATTTVLPALLAVIVVSPWALDLATRISVGQHLQAALDHGIVVFDESIFERIRGVDTVVFDKTGTLTTGEMTVLESHGPADLMRTAGRLERRSTHPIAAAIESAFLDDAGDGSESGGEGSGRSDRHLADGGQADCGRTEGGQADHERGHEIDEFRSHETGVEGVVDGDRVLVGHPDLLTDRGWTIEPSIADRVESARESGQIPVVVGRDGTAEGVIVVGDEPRADWAETVTTLHDRGVEIVVLTGDDRAATDVFRDHPHVDRVFAGVPPNGKTAAIRRLRAEGRVAMIGDGTNDAPALAAADLGLSLGSGTALAADAADVAIVDDDLSAVDRAFRLAAAARTRLKQNLGLALVYNAIAIPIALAGVLNPLVTTGALLVCTGLVVANGWRPLLRT
ncbi:heavy metal translocating P-type ATPase [Halosolutus amylolyticus]|uniref:Heavy metal translocating P-type ATPase n=1 Tax=Halosolutus amylolyticus TaxID=2932267 RepID=A0ABD5PMV9_9EURY|nr:heavy metal translocating P-type ATPase [Halosolutus amylolyticus]